MNVAIGPLLGVGARAVATGIGTAYLYCRWFVLCSTLPFSEALKQLALAFSLSALIRIVVTPAAPVPALSNSLLMATAMGQMVVWYAMQDHQKSLPSYHDSEKGIPAATSTTNSRLRTYGLVALELGIYGVLFGLLRTDVLGWTFTTNSRLLGQITQIVVPLLLFAWLTASAHRQTSAIRVGLLATVALILAIVLFADAVEPTLSVVMFALRCLITMVVYVRLFEMSYRFHAQPCVVYGLGRSWFGWAFIGGLLLYNASLVRSAMDSLPLNVIFFCMACVILLLLNSFSNTAIFSQRTLATKNSTSPVPESPSLREQCDRAAQHFGLSERESQVLYLTCQGLSKRTMAEQLCISEDTVRYHTKRIYGKLAVHNRQELMFIVLNPPQP